jgi:hypothetical protein
VLSNVSANGTAGMCTSARVKLIGIGAATPGRWKVTFTFVPGVPSRMLETCCVFQPRVDCVSICTMRSPSWMPAFSAGVFGKTRATVTKVACSVISIPTPP